MPFDFEGPLASSQKMKYRLTNLCDGTKTAISAWENNTNTNTNNLVVDNVNEFLVEKHCSPAKGFGGIKGSVFETIRILVEKIGSNATGVDAVNALKELKELCPTLMYFDEKCIALLPANPRNGTVLTANPTSISLGGPGGASSHMHVLIIPRIRIYNALTLTKQHIPLLQHMETVGRRVVCQMSVADNYIVPAIKANSETKQPPTPIQPPILDLDWPNMMARIKNTELFDYDGYLPYGFNLHKTSAQDLLGNAGQDVGSFLQVHRDHSIGFLHMHMIPMKLVSKNGGDVYFSEPDYRNMRVSSVIEHLSKLEQTPVSGGAKRAHTRTHAVTWVSTGRQTTLKNGTKRTIYRNSKTNELATKRITERNGKRHAIYTKLVR